jgi:hypothetical protein
VADLITDGNTRVAWLLAIANTASVTTTELNAGTLLHDTMTADGLINFQPATAGVPTSKFSSVFDTAKPGRISYSEPALRFCRQDTDPIYTALPYNQVGFVVVRRDLAAATAWLSTQKIEVYPATCGQRVHLDPESNTLHRWEARLFFSATPNPDSVVA